MFAGDFNFTPNSFYYSMVSDREFRFDLPLHLLSGQHLMKMEETKKLPLVKQIEISDRKIDLNFYMNNAHEYFEELEDDIYDGKILYDMMKEIIN